MFWHEHMNSGGWVFMVLGNIVIWGLIFAFIFWLAQDWRARGRHRESMSEPSANEILDRRVASGEIDTDEYSRLRHAIGEPPRALSRVRTAAGRDLKRAGRRPARLGFPEPQNRP